MATALTRRWLFAVVAIAYVAVAIAFAWPLPAHLRTHLPTPADGDTAVYVWNVWVFHHEVAVHGRWPLATSHVLSPVPSVSLLLHNYTIFIDLVVFGLVPVLGVVGAFNAGNLLLPAMAACTMFLLAWHVTRSAAGAWLAGLAFGFSPYMFARGLGHFSLVGAAPLPLVAWGVVRALETGRWPYASIAGVAVAWAFIMDPYYAIYGVVLACVLALFTAWKVSRAGATRLRATVGRLGAIAALAFTLLAMAMIITGGWDLRVAGAIVRMHALYTPVFVATVGATVWLASRYAVVRDPRFERSPGACARLAVVLVVTCGVLLAPFIPSVVRVLTGGDSLAPPIFWRSGPPGVDALALLAPNPLNGLFGRPFHTWVAALPNGIAENTASIPWVLLAVVGLAAFRRQLEVPRYWTALAVVAAVLALGPFLVIDGVNTYIPGPWILARYIPVLGAARMPGRFVIVLMLAMAVLFACAVAGLLRGARRPGVTATVFTALLLFELAPLPRTLYPARVPGIYEEIRLPGNEQVVLELPVGLTDGLGEAGSFSPSAQFYQTVHENPIVGGYLSRVPREAFTVYQSDPLLHALVSLSAGHDLTPQEEREALEAAASGTTRLRAGFVVMETARTSARLREFAVRALRLEPIAARDGRELYRPAPALR